MKPIFVKEAGLICSIFQIVKLFFSYSAGSGVKRVKGKGVTEKEADWRLTEDLKLEEGNLVVR